MRLTEFQQKCIKTSFLEVYKRGEIYLFGSRVDDTKKGGDIDLYLIVEELENLAKKKVEFLVSLKQKIGDQKIDIVYGRNEGRLIDKIAIREGILL